MQNAAEFLLVVEVKEKQCTDPILLQLKENKQHGLTKARGSSSMSKQIVCT